MNESEKEASDARSGNPEDGPSSPPFRVFTTAEHRTRELIDDEISLDEIRRPAFTEGSTFSIDDIPRATAGSSGFRRPWHISVSGTGVTLKECVYQRGPVIVILGTGVDHEISHTVSAIGDHVYLAAKIDLDAGTATIIEGTSLGDVIDLEVPSDPQFLKKLLYCVKSDGDRLAVLWDYRGLPEVVARV